MLIPPNYSSARPFSNGVAPVISDKWKFINNLGKEGSESKYKDIRSYSNGVTMIIKFIGWSGYRIAYLDLNLAEILTVKRRLAGSLYEELAIISTILPQGFDPREEMYFECPEDSPLVKDRYKRDFEKLRYGFIDLHGNTVIKPKYDFAGRFSEVYVVKQFGQEPLNIKTYFA